MPKKYDWDDLKVFLTLANEGSVAKTSELLHVNQSTVLRRITSLEEALNVTLFIRDKGEYNLTDEGLLILSTVSAMSDQAAALEKTINIHNNSRVAGEVVLSASDFVVSELIAPSLEKLLSEFPALSIRVQLTNAPLNIAKREADIVIRIAFKDRADIPANYYGKCIGTVSLCPYVGKGRDLNQISWLHWEDVDFEEWLSQYNLPPRPAQIISGSPLVNLALMKHADFAAMLPCFLGDADDDVERIEGCDPFTPFEAWVLTHEDMKNTKRITTIMKYLGDCFKNVE